MAALLAVAQVAEPLREHYSLSGVVRFGTLFALIWWAWTGYAVFATRFDADDGIQRVLTLVQMFVVAAMAANAGDELDSRSSAGFAAAYAVLRLVLVAQYFRARHLPEARPLTTRYIVGHGSAALIWLASALVPAPGRYALRIERIGFASHITQLFELAAGESVPIPTRIPAERNLPTGAIPIPSFAFVRGQCATATSLLARTSISRSSS